MRSSTASNSAASVADMNALNGATPRAADGSSCSRLSSTIPHYRPKSTGLIGATAASLALNALTVVVAGSPSAASDRGDHPVGDGDVDWLCSPRDPRAGDEQIAVAHSAGAAPAQVGGGHEPLYTV